jgi:hypothetical protein
VMHRALDRTRRVRERDAMGNESTRDVAVEELPASVVVMYERAAEAIEALELADEVPVSPIDWIRHRVEQAGHSIREITGRSLRVDYSEDVPVLSRVPHEEQSDRVLTRELFNNGELDVVLLNVAGSTGISLHASEKFKDQRPRHMIVAQPAQDINVFVQMLGRINRTGQVELPRFTILNLDLPSEKRPTAMLSQKMRSLNANTTANDEGATSVDVPDILNMYGDQIVWNYLQENEMVRRFLDVDEGDGGDGGLARKATGRLALLPVEDQRAFYEEIEPLYEQHIDYLNRTGQNELTTAAVDLDAELLEAHVIVPGVNPASVFGQDAILGRYDIKAQGKPPTWQEVQDALNEFLEGRQPEQVVQQVIADREAAGAAYREILQERVREAARRPVGQPRA